MGSFRGWFLPLGVASRVPLRVLLEFLGAFFKLQANSNYADRFRFLIFKRRVPIHKTRVRACYCVFGFRRILCVVSQDLGRFAFKEL